MAKRRMQLRAAAVLACTVWLVALVGVEAASIPLLDQYSPLPPNHPQVAQDQRDEGPLRMPPLTRQERIFINERLDDSGRSQSRSQSFGTAMEPEFLNNDNREDSLKSVGIAEDESKDRWNKNTMSFPDTKVAYDDETRSELFETSSKEEFHTDSDNYDEGIISKQEDGFVADDNFEDQGPGSVEVYKLDLYKDRSILSPETLKTSYLWKKSKTPKKASSNHVDWKSRNDEELKTVHPKIDTKSNYLNELVSKSSKDGVFGVGGVPELQVGCEGLEASYRQKRSPDIQLDDQHRSDGANEPSEYATPLSIDVDDESLDDSGELYDELDILFNMRNSEGTTKKPHNGRGDIDPTLKSPAELEAKRKKLDTLPTRGDLGNSTYQNDNQSTNVPSSNQRRLLSIQDHEDHSRVETFRSKRSPGSRRKREDYWGYDEDEGVFGSEELNDQGTGLQDEDRVREEYARGRQEENLRRDEYNRRHESRPGNYYSDRIDSDAERMRIEHEKWLQEQNRRNQPESATRLNTAQLDQEKKRLEYATRQELETRGIDEYNRRNQPSNLRSDEDRRRQEDLKRRREAQRRRQEEEDDKLNDYVRRNQPVNVRNRNSGRPGRTQDDKRNQPSSGTEDYRGRQDADKRKQEWIRKQEEERKLQDYIRRNQPVIVPRRNVTEPTSGTNQRGHLRNDEYARNRTRILESRRMEEARRHHEQSGPPSPNGGRQNHGPSAPNDITKQRKLESDRYEENRRRMEAARLNEEKSRMEDQMRRLQASRFEQERRMQERKRLEEERRIHQAGSAPANLMLDQQRIRTENARREAERMRLEDQRRSQEDERRRQDYERRLQEQRQRAIETTNFEDQRRRQETARLNALPVSAHIVIDTRAPNNGPNGPRIISRFGEDVDYMGINPGRQGLEAARFPAPATARPPVIGPTSCVWAIVRCCIAGNIRGQGRNRLPTCFETMGCPEAIWDQNPCRSSIILAAQKEVMQYYEDSSNEY